MPTPFHSVSNPNRPRPFYCYGALAVQDPAYPQKDAIAVLRGVWGVMISETRNHPLTGRDMVTDLTVYHMDHNTGEYVWEETTHNVNVDSGMAGIFSTEMCELDAEFFEALCWEFENQNEDLPYMGIYSVGVASSATPGCYSVHVARNADGAVIAVRLDYMPDTWNEPESESV